jgi:hypothetical protein
MMLNATETAPKKCLDCGMTLPKLRHTNIYLWRHDRDSTYSDRGWNIPCACGALYVWSSDETGENGGVWKRRHVLQLFDDKLRLPLEKSSTKLPTKRRKKSER